MQTTQANLGRPTPTPVLLVVPPFLDVTYPAIGPSILRARCAVQQIDVKVVYATFDFAHAVGLGPYLDVCASDPIELLGELIFRHAAFAGRDPYAHALTPYVADFVRSHARWLVAHAPRIVGFSSSFAQNLAATAIANEVKRLDSTIVTVLGGANASEPMGRALASLTGGFDVVVSGEAELAFPALCADILNGRSLPPDRVIACDPLTDMRVVPTPDYSDYMTQVAPHAGRGGLPGRLPRAVYFESSRGCWYGQKHHCTFCGLNATGLDHRTHEATRVLADMAAIVAQTGCRSLRATDNIMPRGFETSVLAELARVPVELELQYEVKSNLCAQDLDAFVLAGVTEIQPGIESLSTHVLGLMRKGVTGAQNVVLLREAASRGIVVAWNLLCEIPGESREDYMSQLTLFPLLEHLMPPERWFGVNIDRFSPFHVAPQQFGIGALHPWPRYAEAYGEDAPLDELAYHFGGEYETELTRDRTLRAALGDAVVAWRRTWEPGGTPADCRLDRLANAWAVVTDTRACAQRATHVLSPAQLAALDVAAKPLPVERAAAHARVLDALAESRLVARIDGRWVALPREPHLGVALREERARRRAARQSDPRGQATLAG